MEGCPVRRIGRWIYNADDGLPGEPGWHLDGGPVVLDFMPGHHGCCNGGSRCCRGCYLLSGWPERYFEPAGRYLRDAMEWAERELDEMLAALTGHEEGHRASFGELPWCVCGWRQSPEASWPDGPLLRDHLHEMAMPAGNTSPGGAE